MTGWCSIAYLLMSVAFSDGFYFIRDYYMDNGWPSAFGQVCGKSVEDDCLYLNSHLNSLGILNYNDDIRCTVQLNAGNQHGARYKLKFKRFDVEYTDWCTADALTIYDLKMDAANCTNSIGDFCGDSSPNITGYPTQQYMTLRFATDGSTGRKGYRILATRTLPYPCHDDYFYCKAENRCIDGKLQCDGTPQCDDETDEHGCSFWEKVIGGFLALGLSTIVGIVFLIVFLCTGIFVGICCCTCCKKQCRACRQCCTTMCKPCKSEVQKLKEKMRSAKVGDQNEEGKTGAGKASITDETAKPPTVSSAWGLTDADDTSAQKPSTKTIVAVQRKGNDTPKGRNSDGNETKIGVASTNATGQGVPDVEL